MYSGESDSDYEDSNFSFYFTNFKSCSRMLKYGISYALKYWYIPKRKWKRKFFTSNYSWKSGWKCIRYPRKRRGNKQYGNVYVYLKRTRSFLKN